VPIHGSGRSTHLARSRSLEREPGVRFRPVTTISTSCPIGCPEQRDDGDIHGRLEPGVIPLTSSRRAPCLPVNAQGGSEGPDASAAAALWRRIWKVVWSCRSGPA
jgi:hypothetical protein